MLKSNSINIQTNGSIIANEAVIANLNSAFSEQDQNLNINIQFANYNNIVAYKDDVYKDIQEFLDKIIESVNEYGSNKGG